MRKSRSGFSLIEVVLVMGIAALIMGMAFIALPGLWANERDGERRDDVMLLVSTVQKYQTNNNRGALPSFPGTTTRDFVNGSGVSFACPGTGSSWSDFYNCYLNSSFMDPDGAMYNLNIVECGTTCDGADLGSGAVDHTMHIFTKATCDGDTAVPSANTRKIAVEYKMERAGQFCYNS